MIISREQVRAARAWLNWSARELADESGVSHGTIAKYERGSGESRPTDPVLLDLRAAFLRFGVEPLFSHGNPIGVRLLDADTRKLSGANIFPEQIRAARGWLGWAGKDLADESGISYQWIAKFERGEVDSPPKGYLAALYSALVRAGIEPVFTEREPSGVRVTNQSVPVVNLRQDREAIITKRSLLMARMRDESRVTPGGKTRRTTLQAIGDRFGVSRQRVKQILKEHDRAIKENGRAEARAG